MPKITYIEHDGTQHTVDGEIGATVMETALRHSVPGIVAECGGSCTCATCMVYVAEEWKDRVGARSDEEEDQLDQAFAFTGAVMAQGYPTKPVTVVVPWPAGGPSDLAARPLAKGLSDILGKPLRSASSCRPRCLA
jgi:2Fe-2S ferredoxin